MKTTTFHDIDHLGLENKNGTAKEYSDDAALSVAFTIWMTSKRGDYIRDPQRGGPLDVTLFKNLSKLNLEKIEFSLSNAITFNFGEILRLKKITVVPKKSLDG